MEPLGGEREVEGVEGVEGVEDVSRRWRCEGGECEGKWRV